MAQILAFGDSNVEGVLDSGGGWVGRLKKEINKKNMADDDYWCMVRNLGISGDTSIGLIARFMDETKARMNEGDDPVVIFGIGGNDSAYVGKIGNPCVPEKRFERNINALMMEAKKFTDRVIFLEINMRDEDKVYRKPWLGFINQKYFYGNERSALYSSIIEKACNKHGIYFLKRSKEFGGNNYKKLLSDGLHLNARGHQVVFEDVLKFLNSKKWI